MKKLLCYIFCLRKQIERRNATCYILIVRDRINTPLSFFLEWRPFCCLKKMSPTPVPRAITRTISPTRNPNKAVAKDKTDDGCTCCGCRPVDVSPLNAHKFQWSLQATEYGILKVVAICHRHSALKAEEHGQCLGCCDEEDTSANDHHDLLLEILLNFCKYLILRNYWRHKIAKGTNWKQKFQKPQNENISLTNLNMENKRNFPILSFGLCIEGEVKSLKKESSTWGKVWSEYPNVYELWPKSVKIWHQLEENF